VGFSGGATYCATKFFVMGLSESLHAELRDSGVKVSCILPGLVDTELVAGLKVPRFLRATRPETVADAIVEAVRRNRFETFVPRAMGGASRLTALFPRRIVEAAGKAVGAERALFHHDRTARRAYDERVKEKAG
jgi:short-subunit dehydrogenase